MIARLFGLIVSAFHSGHSHRSIYDAIASGGVTTGWSNYRMALRRARKAQSKAIPLGQPPEHAAPSGAIRFDEPHSTAPVLSGTAETSREMNPSRDGSAGTSTATHVMDALRQAREVASKDYGRIARELYRESQRKPKDRS